MKRLISQWWGPAALALLSVAPLLGAVVRLSVLAGAVAPKADDARFLSAPWPIVLHVLAAVPFSLLGAFQFSAVVRERWGAWHRRAGRALALLGVVAALSGLWMVHVYAVPESMQGPLLRAVRWLVGLGMVASIVLGVRAILRRDVGAHEAWMMRAYALGQGAGTQAVLLGPWLVLSGPVLGLSRDVFLSLAWLLNLLVVEWVLLRSVRAESRTAEA